MTVPEAVVQWLQATGWGEVVGTQPVSGGCIHDGRVVRTSSGRRAFLKTNTRVPPDMFRREAEGLEALGAAGALRVPEVLAVGEDFLLLEDLAPAPAKENYWPEFGRRLARLHQSTSERFGFDHDNYLGSTLQPNPRVSDGFAFFAVHRLGYQADLARQHGRITAEDAEAVHRLAVRLREFIPEQPASLIHGDLWSGNMLSDAEGRPAVIDPAVHYGWREADLAMTALFSSPPEAFYAGYQEITPLLPGWRQRFPLYNLYHLLNHVNLFGGGYLAQVRGILRRFL